MPKSKVLNKHVLAALVPGARVNNSTFEIAVETDADAPTVIFNVGGVIFETYRSTLCRHTDTNVSDEAFLEKFYRHTQKDYFFDHDPVCFSAVLEYLRTGELHLPPNVCGPALKRELDFWGVSEHLIQNCCWNTYDSWNSTYESLQQLERDRKKIFVEYEAADPEDLTEWQKFRRNTWNLVTNHTSSCGAKKHIYIYCELCQKGWKENIPGKHPDHSGDSIEFPGITLLQNFISELEEEFLVNEIDKTSFVDSQSGRRKQDYGPKVNFKKKKIKCDSFTGLPAFSKFVVDRFTALKNLSDFTPVELCNLEYDPVRGAAIDAHFDDFWIWGERLITLNLLSDTYLTMTIDSLPSKLLSDQSDLLVSEVRVPLPCRSLVVVSGPARYDWKHGILRHDISKRRLAMTFRELTPEFLPGGLHYEDIGHQVIETALTYCGISMGEVAKKNQIS